MNINDARLHTFLNNSLALVAGCILPLSFAPFDFWVAGPVSIFLLLFAVKEGSNKLTAIRFYLFSVGLYGVGISWVYVSIHDHGQAPPILAGTLVVLLILFLSLPWLLQGYLYRKYFCFAPVAASVGFAVLWATREWLLTWLFTGFPWLLVGYGHITSPLSIYAPYVGVLGIGFLLVFSASALFSAFQQKAKLKQLMTLLPVAFIWLGTYWLEGIVLVNPIGEPVTVSLVQGNIDQEKKWRRDMIRPIMDTYIGLSKAEWGRKLVVWPEAALTVYRSQATSLLDELDSLGKRRGTSLILGIPEKNEQGGVFNAAIVLGNGQGEYFKRLLVPFGEYIPFDRFLRGVIAAFDLPMSNNQAGLMSQDYLRAGDLAIAMSICYEIVFPNLVRTTGKAPDVLMTISNDTWFGTSIGPLQHMQMAQMRAMESGRYLIRATNSGVTALVNPKGEIYARLPQFEIGVLRGEVWKMEGETPFFKFGHKPILMLIAVLLLCLFGWRYRDTH